MKMRLQIRSKIKNLLCSSLFLAPVLFFCCSNAKADGVILIKGNPTQSPQFWTALAFRKIEGFSITYTVSLTNGQLRNFRKDEVGAILEEPKWQEMTVVSDADWQNLEKQKAQLLSTSGQYPQLNEWANALAAKFDALLNRESSSLVLYRGKLIQKNDYDKMRGAGQSTTVSPGVSLTIDGKSYNNIRITSVKDNRVAFQHESGISSVDYANLTEPQKVSLAKAFPETFDPYHRMMMSVRSMASASSGDDVKANALSAENKAKLFTEILSAAPRSNIPSEDVSDLKAKIECNEKADNLHKILISLNDIIANPLSIKNRDISTLDFNPSLKSDILKIISEHRSIEDAKTRDIDLFDKQNRWIKISFLVVKRLEEGAFPEASPFTGNLYEIKINRKPALLKTTQTLFQSPGYAEMYVTKDAEILVGLTNGFTGLADVLTELPSSVMRRRDVLVIEKNDAEKHFLTKIEALKSNTNPLLQEIFGQKATAIMLDAPKISLSQKLIELGFSAKIFSPSIEKLKKFLLDEDWSGGYSCLIEDILPDDFIAQNKLPANAAMISDLDQVNAALDGLRTLPLPLVLKSNLIKGQTDSDELYWTDEQSSGAATNMPKLMICKTTIPSSISLTGQNILQKLKSSDPVGTTEFINTPKPYYRHKFSPLPDFDGITDDIYLDGFHHVFFTSPVDDIHDHHLDSKLESLMSDIVLLFSQEEKRYKIDKDMERAKLFTSTWVAKFNTGLINYLVENY